jgi:aryl-alcohol dehydrogenase-like predicted oxidoreductase
MRSRTPKQETSPLDATLLRATPEGTEDYKGRFAERFADDFYRRTAFGLTISSIGIGTYLGECLDDQDSAYTASVLRAISGGINLVDTAINYRCQRSELAVGAAIQAAIADGVVARESLVVCTKGGYVPLEHEPPESREGYQAYLEREFLDRQIFRSEELVAGGHCLTPRFLRYCIAKSRQNLGLRTIDIYYLHNPEQQLAAVARGELRSRLRAAFATLEETVGRGDIGVYGCATWNGLRAPPETKGHLSLEELVAAAREVAGDSHHFRAVQLPVNLAMPEAIRAQTQRLGSQLVTPLDAASELGLTVIASASLMQARLASGLPDEMRDLFPKCRTDAQRAIAFVRSVSGVTSALVGMRSEEHVEENLGSAVM